MACGVNVFIVQLEHAILYPECINTKKSTASCMRWEKSHFACVALRTSHPRGSTKVKGFFFCHKNLVVSNELLKVELPPKI